MSKNLSLKNEFLRKSIHVCNSIFAYSLLYFNQEDFTLIIALLTFLILLFETLRNIFPNVNFLFKKFFGSIIRDFESLGKLTGASFVFISTLILLLFFDKYTCIFAILVMSYSDTVAALVGKKYGKTKIFNKTLEGSVAFFIVGCIIAILIYPNINLYTSILAVLFATIIESLPLKIDDNLSVPMSIAFFANII